MVKKWRKKNENFDQKWKKKEVPQKKKKKKNEKWTACLFHNLIFLYFLIYLLKLFYWLFYFWLNLLLLLLFFWTTLLGAVFAASIPAFIVVSINFLPYLSQHFLANNKKPYPSTNFLFLGAVEYLIYINLFQLLELCS